MKATGIVRRIDELGRVVIPKEIRRTLRIRESDPLKIFTDRDGGIILRKYSPIGEISDHAQELCASLFQSFSLPALICDKDVVVAAAGFGRRDVSGHPVSAEIVNAILRRSRIIQLQEGEKPFPFLSGDDPFGACVFLVCMPIISQSDSIGGVLMLSQKPDLPIEAAAVKACEVAALFLSKQTE